MDKSIERLFEDFNVSADNFKTLLRNMMETVSQGKVPDETEALQLDQAIKETRQRYESIYLMAVDQLNDDEMPGDNKPVTEYVEAIRHSAAILYKKQLEEIRHILADFISVKATVDEYAKMLQPYKEAAAEVLSHVSEEEAPEIETLEAKAAGPRAFLEALSYGDVFTGAWFDLMDRVNDYYERPVQYGIAARVYSLEAADNKAEAVLTPVEEVPSVELPTAFVEETESDGDKEAEPEDELKEEAEIFEEMIQESMEYSVPESHENVDPECKTCEELAEAESSTEITDEFEAGADSNEKSETISEKSLSAFAQKVMNSGMLLDSPALIGQFSKDSNPNSEAAISAEEFKSEFKTAKSSVKDIIKAVSENNVITLRHLSLLGTVKDKKAKPALESLLRKGYVNKYTLSPHWSFYCSSDRLRKALSFEDAARIVGMEPINLEAWGEAAEENAASAANRIVFEKSYCDCLDIFIKAKLYNFTRTSDVSTDSFVQISGATDHDIYNILTVGAFWCETTECDYFLEKVKELLDAKQDHRTVVFAAVDLQKARILADLVMDEVGGPAAFDRIYFYSLKDDSYFSYPDSNKAGLKDIWETLRMANYELEVSRDKKNDTEPEAEEPEVTEPEAEEPEAEEPEEMEPEAEEAEADEIVVAEPEAEEPEAEEAEVTASDAEELEVTEPEVEEPEAEEPEEMEPEAEEPEETEPEAEEPEDINAENKEVTREGDTFRDESISEEADANAAPVKETQEEDVSSDIEEEKAEKPAKPIHVKAAPPPHYITISEDEKQNFIKNYEKILISGKHYGATAYVKSLSRSVQYFNDVYQQLAYALNDPMAECSYSSSDLYSLYYGDEEPVSDYFAIAAVMRNYFYDQFSYDYSLQQLYSVSMANTVLHKYADIEKIVYYLYDFKKSQNRGIDRYADYREMERVTWEKQLKKTQKDANEYYAISNVGNLKENASHKRFIETSKILFGPGSDLSEYLKVVIADSRDMVGLLEDYLAENFIKDHAEIDEVNIDSAKVNHVLDAAWEESAKSIRFVKKSSTIMSSLRMNLIKRINKIAIVLCRYVTLIRSMLPNETDLALIEYKRTRQPLLESINNAITKLETSDNVDLSARAGEMVILTTLYEFKARIEGNYKEGENRYFYINFLKNDKVLLDDEYMPILDEVPELPDFSVCSRILQHCNEPEKDFDTRVVEIASGGDDYGSLELILQYVKDVGIELKDFDNNAFSLEDAIVYPKKDTENKRVSFIEDLELAQSYGKFDNAKENSKEIIIQIMESWFEWANETHNYGFFAKILEQFREKIHKDAQMRAVDLQGNLNIYKENNPGCKENPDAVEAIKKISERIEQQNYAAAEDLLNRLLTNDLDFEVDLFEKDYLKEFLDEYDVNYRRTANSATNLKALFTTTRINKDTKGANRLLDNWPGGSGVTMRTFRFLLEALGFSVDRMEEEPLIQGKIRSFQVYLKRPQNGRKINYKHPIYAFGSEAEINGFRLTCVFGKTDSDRLIETFRDIGNAQNTIVILDYALTLSDRRALARKAKVDLVGKIFAVIDRVVLAYLMNHYTETSINRMLMAVVMPFASYQPYISKSADVMPQEIFIGRKTELNKIEAANGVNIVYGGRQLGKTAMLRMAKKDIDHNENNDRAIIVNAWKKDYKETAKAVSAALYDEGVLKTENITEDWSILARDIKNRLRDTEDRIPYLLLMIDEADTFIESCEAVEYKPLNELKDIQDLGNSSFKFVLAGLRNIVRFKRMAALENNNMLIHLSSLTVKPFKTLEARELLEVPLSYLGFRFPKNAETDVLISTIFGTTNYFPGLIQLYCMKLIEAVQRNYAGYSESETPPYFVQKEQIKKVLAEQSLQEDIRDKFFITLKVGDDDYYYIIALLAAYHYHDSKDHNGCSAEDILSIADNYGITKITSLDEDNVTALMEEMTELNVFQPIGDGRYRFARHSFCRMMGNMQEIEDVLLNNYMEG